MMNRKDIGLFMTLGDANCKRRSGEREKKVVEMRKSVLVAHEAH